MLEQIFARSPDEVMATAPVLSENDWHKEELLITTLVSLLTRASEPRSRAGRSAGAAVQDARRAKERTYPELLQTRRCKLVVLAIEVGGRWSQETTTFLRLLAQAKARTIPARRKASFTNALIHRFWLKPFWLKYFQGSSCTLVNVSIFEVSSSIWLHQFI